MAGQHCFLKSCSPGLFIPLWTFTCHEPTAQQHLEGSHCRSQHTPAQPPPYTHPKLQAYPEGLADPLRDGSVSHIEGDATHSRLLLNIWKWLSQMSVWKSQGSLIESYQQGFFFAWFKVY